MKTSAALFPVPYQVTPASKLHGRIARVLNARGKGRFDFCSHSVEALDLDFEGIISNRHRGYTRRADARVPYLKRCTEMRNSRQLSVVSTEDCTELARRLELSSFDPAWIGANVVVEGFPYFSYLPRGAKLIFEGGAVLDNEDQNSPCVISGEAVARATAGRDDIKLQFTKVAKGLRGIIVTVEHPGVLVADSPITIRLPEQWIYN